MDIDDFNFLYSILSATEHTFTLGSYTNFNIVHVEHTNHVTFTRTTAFCAVPIRSNWILPNMQLINLLDNAARIERKRQQNININIRNIYKFGLGESHYASINISQGLVYVYKCLGHHVLDIESDINCTHSGVTFSPEEWYMFLAMVPYISKRIAHEVCNI